MYARQLIDITVVGFQEMHDCTEKCSPVVLWHESDERPRVVEEGPASAAQAGQEEDELLPLAKLADLLENQVVAHCGDGVSPLLSYNPFPDSSIEVIQGDSSALRPGLG